MRNHCGVFLYRLENCVPTDHLTKWHEKHGGHSKSRFNKLWLVGGKKGLVHHTFVPPQIQTELIKFTLFVYTKSNELNSNNYFYFLYLIKMQHLLKKENGITYVHTIYGRLFKMNEPIEEIIRIVENCEGIGHLMKDSTGKEFRADRHVDLIFNSEIIWHNDYNEEFFNEIKKQRC